MPFISRCCAAQSETTSGESKGSGPERIEDALVEHQHANLRETAVGVERAHRHLVEIDRPAVRTGAARAVVDDATLAVVHLPQRLDRVRAVAQLVHTAEERGDLFAA